VIADPQVQVVHVCTPNHLHRAMAQAALEAGKHVICEKPLATTLDDAQALAALAASTGLVATVPFVYRYHPVVREARARIAQGDLGPLHLIHGSYLQDWLLDPASNNWRVDPALGGTSRVFADIGSHWCDLVEWVSGERFTEVNAAFATVIAERSAVTGQSFSTPAAAARRRRSRARTWRGDVQDRRRHAGVVDGEPGLGRTPQPPLVRDRRRQRQHRLRPGGRRAAVDRPARPARGNSCAGRRGHCRTALAVGAAGRHAQGYAQCFEAFVADTYRAIDGEQPDGLPTFEDGMRSARIVDRVIASARSRAWTTIG
jgi:predicted dehydrogenase